MSLNKMIILIKSGGEMASGIALRLHKSHFKVCITEISHPQAVRREVSFCEAVYESKKTVEGVTARLVESYDQIPAVWDSGQIPVIVDAETRVKDFLKPPVLVDAILAKKNLGTKITDASLVIGLGPGFYAGRDVHLVVETNRGHNLGRLISEGSAEKNTGIPGVIAGFAAERVFRAPRDGRFTTLKEIGDYIDANETIALVEDMPVQAKIKGVIRGLLKSGTKVWKGMKTGDVDPRGIKEFCYTVSEKARALGGGVLEGILSHFNK